MGLFLGTVLLPLLFKGEGPRLGGAPTPLPAEHWKSMQSLIVSLSKHPPDDYLQLPPPGRRAILQVRLGRKVGARVYDRDLPDSILEILGLTGATHGSLTMNFAPPRLARRWKRATRVFRRIRSAFVGLIQEI